MTRLTAPTTILLIVLTLPSCRTSRSGTETPVQAEPRVSSSTVQPGAPGDPTGPVRIVDGNERSARAHTAADTGFMQGMIAHHAQALEMTALVPSRTDDEDFRLFARRIEDSQRTEIALMQRWLRERGEHVPQATGDPKHEMGQAGDALMPGMLTREEMLNLERSTGKEFERLFLKYMISHHEGALVMVGHLLATDGAAQDGEVFRFAADVDADQRMEIGRMNAMLERYQKHNNSGDD